MLPHTGMKCTSVGRCILTKFRSSVHNDAGGKAGDLSLMTFVIGRSLEYISPDWIWDLDAESKTDRPIVLRLSLSLSLVFRSWS